MGVQHVEAQMRKQPGPWITLGEFDGLPFCLGSNGHSVDRSKRACHEAAAGRKEFSVVTSAPDEVVDDNLEGLFPSLGCDPRAVEWKSDGILPERIDLVESENVVEKSSDPVFKARGLDHSVEFSCEIFDLVKLSVDDGLEQLLVRATIPKELAES
jgi:hypothetical protein